MAKTRPLLLVVSVVFGLMTGSVWGQVRAFSPVTEEMLLQPDPADWLMPSRTYDWQRFSPLDQIHRGNVQQLRLAWVRGMGPGIQETTPLVHNGVMYVVNPGALVQALDATIGDLIWEYRRELPDGGAAARSRNLAIYDDVIFYAAPDGYLVGLDARTGQLRCDDWDLDHVQERMLVKSAVDPDPKAVKWINPGISRGEPLALGGIAKVNVATGQLQRFHTQRVPGMGATLATAGDLVFWGDLNRRFYAFDADSGKILWETVLGGTFKIAPSATR